MNEKILFFDWKKILSNARTMKDIVKAIDIKQHNLIPKNCKDPFFHLYGKDISGTSFILNPERFLSIKASIDDKVFCLNLASKRDYAQYKLFNNRGLDLRFITEDIYSVKSNKLIEIENNTIYFKFEENT